MNTFLFALAGIGAVVMLQFAYSAAQFLAFHFLIPSQPLAKYKRAGSDAYALITGASAGIGLGIAQELVRQGFGVILLGHLPEELASAAATLCKIRPDAPVRTLVLDARTATPEEMQAAVASLAPLTLTILVNNVGGNPVAAPRFRQHATYTPADVDAVINQNARFMARLTALTLPLLSRTSTTTPTTTGNIPRQEERSLILTLSSAAHLGIPYFVMYGATKAFNRAFGFALARELAADPATQHVDSLVVVPGEVRSQGNSRGLPARAPTWDVFGREVVCKVDGAVGRGWREMHPHWWHGVEDVLIRAAPEGVKTRGVTEQLTVKKVAWDEVFAVKSR